MQRKIERNKQKQPFNVINKTKPKQPKVQPISEEQKRTIYRDGVA